MNSDLPCPSCGFETLEDSYGSYVICDICGWEDDGVQLANPYSVGGANKESLAMAQEKAIKKYPLDIKILKGFKRSSSWRPLSNAELTQYKEQTSEKPWLHKAILYESESYWVKNS